MRGVVVVGASTVHYRALPCTTVHSLALPQGSALASAEWSETCVSLGHIAGIILLLIISHCIDGVCNVEMDSTVGSARASFIECIELLGLRLDSEKSKEPAVLSLENGSSCRHHSAAFVFQFFRVPRRSPN